ncbi:DUF3616 domain-containing protein [endosymbiont of Ridgeia piscesae]|jgi:hypothetical protein|uniref:DUF3616 domain-containing protein n=1 Tax=endosymbiont of Ridgeia piscesae TaxID=54398 RepID=A0A0T5YZJ1_9GAMM|nr:DUF3616 domain-containing protein [endosymbiont of Ridgeia piscesae]KRT56042.1 Protein of unknown function (DUF3616) [endosymbiont of Ridgeia piscesae]KRT57331.1 Protein of unknown function (DUF3616) [endosymbiont of Ridgeia piscesae]
MFNIAVNQLKSPADISAIGRHQGLLLIGSDEASGERRNENYLQLFRADGQGHYQLARNILLYKGSRKKGRELDIEGIASDGESIYVIGSHSLKRKQLNPAKSHKKNLKRLHGKSIIHEKSRDQLFRLRINSQGNIESKQRISLRKLLRRDPVLQPFSAIPGKENGVDIEGIAVRDGWLYAAFRGPVLRDGLVPILRFRFDDPQSDYELRFVTLGGLGCREITRVSDGFLILAGPNGKGPGDYRIFHWDGRDTLPGADRPQSGQGKIRLLHKLEPPAGGKAEGLALLDESEQDYHLLVAFDGISHANIHSLVIPKNLST